MRPYKIPYFIEIRGCINCNQSKEIKKRYGRDYGYCHEMMAGCLLRGCLNRGFSLSNPFIDVAEIARFAKEHPEFAKRASEIILQQNKRFGKAYQAIGVNLSEMIKECMKGGRDEK